MYSYIILCKSSVVVLDFIHTDGSDYRLTEALLTFQAGSSSATTACAILQTVPDSLEEANETVVVRVVPVDPDTTVGGSQNTVTITILNNDGEKESRKEICDGERESTKEILGKFSHFITYSDHNVMIYDKIEAIILFFPAYIVNCPALPVPSYPSVIDRSSGVIEGATIVYSCAPGYKLLGESKQRCINGVWSGKEPICTGGL